MGAENILGGPTMPQCVEFTPPPKKSYFEQKKNAQEYNREVRCRGGGGAKKKCLLSAAKASQRLTLSMNIMCRAQPAEGVRRQEGGDASNSAA